MNLTRINSFTKTKTIVYTSVLMTLAGLIRTTPSYSQHKNFQVKGHVYDETSKKPVSAVSIELYNASPLKKIKSTTSDSTGKFSFQVADTGHFIIRLSDIMHEGLQQKVTIINSDINIDTLYLTTRVTTLQEIAVVTKKQFIERKVDKLVLNVESSPASAGGSIMDVLQTAPGVSVTDDLISIKGKKGVTIMINGRPSSLSSSDLTRILQNFPAGAVTRIEILTNPSAQNDAAGSAGIINIVTKKLQVDGFNGSINGSAGFGVYPKYNGGVILNYKVNRLNLFGNYNISNTTGFGKYTSKRIIDQLVFDETGHTKAHNSSQNFNIGLDYEIGKKQLIGISMSGDILKSNSREDFNTKFIQNKMDSSLRVYNVEQSDYNNLSWNLHHNFNINNKGRKLTTNIDYSTFSAPTDALFSNSYMDQDGGLLREVEQLRNNSEVSIKIGSAKMDYTHPVSKMDMTIMAGLKSSIVRTDSDIRFDNKYGDSWHTDTGKTNHFIYDEYINAAYFNVNKKIGDYEIQAGLRAEQTNNTGNLITGNLINKNDYVQFFPSFFISRKLGASHQINFSYGRRINRPSYEDLNPFIFYNSPYSYYQGNTSLRPEFTNALELGYSLNDEFLVSFSYSHTKDYFTYLSYLNDTTKVTKESISNFNRYRSLGTSLSLDKDLFDWWHLSCNADIFYEEFSSFYQTQAFKNNIINVNTNLTTEFSLPGNSALLLTGIYRSPTLDGIKKNLSRYKVDLGYRKSWFDKKLILKVAARDIFYIYRRNGINRIGNLNQEFTNRNDSRVISFDLTYKFGNQKKKTSREKTSNTDELKRIKGLN